MTLLLVLLVLVPWSIWRQMHAHEITREGLIKLPIIFAAIGVAGMGTRDIPTDGAALGYLAFSLLLSIAFGVWRGARIDIWRDADGNPISQGNRTTITLWIALIATKFVLGAAASITEVFPGEHTGEIFLFIAFSFVAQNIVVARRAQLNAPRRAAAVTA